MRPQRLLQSVEAAITPVPVPVPVPVLARDQAPVPQAVKPSLKTKSNSIHYLCAPCLLMERVRLIPTIS